MKRSTFLKLAMVCLAAFVYVGAMAQYPATIASNYVEVSGTTYTTAGKTFRLYVAPDPVYSPDYDGSDVNDINADARWTWTYAYPGTLEGTPATGVVSPARTNWVEFTTVVSGTYTVAVVESNTVTSCADASPVSQTVIVIDAPTAVIGGSVTNGNYSWSDISSGSAFIQRSCAPGTTGTETITVTITEDSDLPGALRSYAFRITETVQNVMPDLSTPDGAVISSNDWDDYTVANKLKTGHPNIPGGHTWTPNDAGTATSTYSFATSTLAVANSKPTRYTYTLLKATDLDAAEDGIVSNISHNSDYVRMLTPGQVVDGHPFGTITSVQYIVLPAPVTGPIYHIPNNFRF